MVGGADRQNPVAGLHPGLLGATDLADIVTP